MLALAALLAAAATAPAPAPAEIYRAALQRLATLAQPAYIDMTEHRRIVAQSSRGDAPYILHERVLFDSTARRECVLFLPYSGDGSFIISPSYFAPDMWLIRRPLAAPASTAESTPAPTGETNFAPDLSDLKTIADVVSVEKPSYGVRLAGIDKLTNGGGTAYHLVLNPHSDPWKHNLRQLWVNTANFNIVRAVLVGDYRPDPGAMVEQTTVAEDFGAVGPYWVVIHHTWTYRDAAAGVTYHFDSTATKMSFPSSIPAWYFDEAQFKRHRAQVNLTSSWP